MPQRIMDSLGGIPLGAADSTIPSSALQLLKTGNFSISEEAFTYHASSGRLDASWRFGHRL
jgi:hypothetical protein